MFYVYLSALTLSIVIKIVVWRRLRKCGRSPVRSLAMAFVAIAYAESILEIYILYISFNPSEYNLTFILRSYYMLIVAQAVLLPVTIWSVLKHNVPRPGLIGSVSLAFLLSLSVAASEHIVADAVAIPHSITRVPGDYYWIFSVVVMFGLIATLMLPTWVYIRSSKEVEKAKCANMLCGASMLFLIVTGVIVLMANGFAINAMGFVPPALAIFLYSVAVCLHPTKVTDIRADLPWTKKYRTIRMLTSAFRSIDADQPLNSKDAGRELQDELILQAKKLFDTDRKAADWLNISPAKFSRDYNRITKSLKNK